VADPAGQNPDPDLSGSGMGFGKLSLNKWLALGLGLDSFHHRTLLCLWEISAVCRFDELILE
jgi:hypothetical protein